MAIIAGAAALEALIASEALTSLVMQLVGQVVSAALAPELTGLQEESYRLDPSLALSVADAVEAVIKGHLDHPGGAAEARLSGIDDRRFGILVDNAGDAPAPQTLLELWRRQVIPETGTGAAAISVEQGIREGRTKNKWIEPLKALRYELPSPQAALQALLEGQTDEATARNLYSQWGGDARYFQLMFDTQGSAPSPLEAAEMARRNIIPWDGEGAGVTSYRQAFLEGPWRNKWEKPFRALADYIPPPRTVTAMVREGALDDAEALQLFKAAGLTPDLAAKYLAAAHHQKVATTKDLAKGDVLALYTDKLIDGPTATAMLGKLNYSAENAAFELAIADFRQQRRLVEAALTRLRTLYIARKLDKPAAAAAMDQLGLTPAARDNQLTDWDLIRVNTVAVLSAAELAAAVKQSWLDPQEALNELQGRGYSERDAWIYLATHLKAAPTQPAPPGVGPRTTTQ